jgi:hypothetical protein
LLAEPAQFFHQFLDFFRRIDAAATRAAYFQAFSGGPHDDAGLLTGNTLHLGNLASHYYDSVNLGAPAGGAPG